MVLTEKQRRDLHGAIHEYLAGAGDLFPPSLVDDFAKAAGISSPRAPSNNGTAGLLEKKWTSVVRLQKKVMDLEAQLEAAKEAGVVGGAFARAGAKSGAPEQRLLPRAPARAVLSGHRGPVTCVCVHPIFSVCASGSEDGTIRVWDLDSGEFERGLKGHTNSVQGCCFSPNGELLASCSSDISVKLWDFKDNTYECVKTLRGHDHNISQVRWLPDSASLVSCSRDGTIRVWEVESGYCVRTLGAAGGGGGTDEWVRSVDVEPAKGEALVSGGNDQAVTLWNVTSGQVLKRLTGHEHVVEAVAFAGEQQGKGLATALDMNHEDASSLSLAQFVVSASRDKTVKLWNATLGQCVATFADHENWVRDVIVHPTRPFLLSCSDDKSVRVYDVKAKRGIRTLDGAHSHFITSLAMRGNLFVTGGVDRVVHVWECH